MKVNVRIVHCKVVVRRLLHFGEKVVKYVLIYLYLFRYLLFKLFFDVVRMISQWRVCVYVCVCVCVCVCAGSCAQRRSAESIFGGRAHHLVRVNGERSDVERVYSRRVSTLSVFTTTNAATFSATKYTERETRATNRATRLSKQYN